MAEQPCLSGHGYEMAVLVGIKRLGFRDDHSE